MTLEEAIRLEESIVNQNETKMICAEDIKRYQEAKEYKNYADEHRQVVKYLNELKQYKSILKLTRAELEGFKIETESKLNSKAAFIVGKCIEIIERNLKEIEQ